MILLGSYYSLMVFMIDIPHDILLCNSGWDFFYPQCFKRKLRNLFWGEFSFSFCGMPILSACHLVPDAAAADDYGVVCDNVVCVCVCKQCCIVACMDVRFCMCLKNKLIIIKMEL